MRPFELAMMGACIVCNPYCGIERWFEPGREIVVVGSAEEAIDRYRFLIAHDAERRAMGEAARRRALAEHTFRHRASQLVEILKHHVDAA
jgi:spore maturation protein CgeB